MALLDKVPFNQAGILNFLGRPETMALAQGLLSGSQPSMTQPVTFGGALAQGLGNMQTASDAEKKRKLEQDKFAIDKLLKEAQINKYNVESEQIASGRNQNLTGLPQEYASLEAFGQRVGYNHPDYIAAKEELDLRRQNIESNIKNREEIAKRKDFTALPVDAKNHIIAMGNAMGIRPDEMIQRTNAGETIEDIAIDKGIDINTLKPEYVPTKTNVTNIKQRAATLSELNVFDKKITNAMSKYSRTFLGMSPQLMLDQLKNENPDDVAQYLAARALQPEIATLRVNAAGGNVNQGMIEGMVDKSLGNSRIYQGLVSPEVYSKMQGYLGEWLNEGADAAQKSMFGIKETPEELKGTVPVYFKGKKYNVPSNKVQEALADGGSLSG